MYIPILAQLERYASREDRVLQAVGMLSTVAAGIVLPVMTIFFGSAAQQILQLPASGLSPVVPDTVKERALEFVYLGVGAGMATYVSTCCWMMSGERISVRLRERYLLAVMNHSVQFFEYTGGGEIAAQITADIESIQDSISDKLGLCLGAATTCMTALIIAIWRDWKLGLIAASSLPVMVGLAFLLEKKGHSAGVKVLPVRAKAISFFEAVISWPQVAQVLAVENRLGRMFDQYLAEATNDETRQVLWKALNSGWVLMFRYSLYPLVIYTATKMTDGADPLTAKFTTVAFSTIVASYAIGQFSRNYFALVQGLAAGSHILNSINETFVPCQKTINSETPDLLRDKIQFHHVTFSYPSRPEIMALRDLTLEIRAGQVTAIVGHSGAGKSTMIDLIERFYEVSEGMISVDGLDIKQLDLSRWRSNIAIVDQRTQLFSDTIYNNIACGLVGTPQEDAGCEVKERLVNEVVTDAGLRDLIDNLPEGLHTNLLRSGHLLSGGQRQRIAIARAFIRRAAIIIFDEATSSLDLIHERHIYDSLRRNYSGTTVILITHRLKTTQQADQIIFLDGGQAIEQGSHDELVNSLGAYSQFVDIQIAEEHEKNCLPPEENSISQTGQITSAPDDELKTASYISNSVEGSKMQWSIFALIHKLSRFNHSENFLMAFGCIVSAIIAAGIPLQSWIFANVAITLGQPAEAGFERKSALLALALLATGLVMATTKTLGEYFLACCSEVMIRRLRGAVLRALLKKPYSWFEKETYHKSKLLYLVVQHVSDLKALHASQLSIVLTTITSILATASFAVIVTWRLSAVALITFPLTLLATFYRTRMLRSMSQHRRTEHQIAARYAVEVADLIRTISAFGMQNDVIMKYRRSLHSGYRNITLSILKGTTILAAARSFTYLANAFTIWYGAKLIVEGQISHLQFYVAFLCVSCGAQEAGNALTNSSNVRKAIISGQAVFEILSQSREGLVRAPALNPSTLTLGSAQNLVALRDVEFVYEQRPQVLVLNNISLKFHRGQHYALVGLSGSGKSTLLKLLARIYQPTHGTIEIAGTLPETKSGHTYEKRIAYVPQDVAIYPGSIEFNILLGLPEQECSSQKLQDACKAADLWDFVLSLPEGLRTQCGQNGIALSGGQRQRIAIARALIGDPSILLLDEATSELDAKSAAAVQSRLKDVSNGRTVISVTHDETFFKDADEIIVLHKGKVVDKGTHSTLMNSAGVYAHIVHAKGLVQGD